MCTTKRKAKKSPRDPTMPSKTFFCHARLHQALIDDLNLWSPCFKVGEEEEEEGGGRIMTLREEVKDVRRTQLDCW